MRASFLGNYSVLSLQFPDRLCFISIVLANSFDAEVKASKLKLLMQLNSDLVDVKIGNNRLFVKYALDFESDRSAEGHACGSTEGKVHFILCVVIRSNVISHRDGNREGGLSLTSKFLDRNTENIDRKLIARLVISKGESASSFPGPVSVIENLNLDILSLSRNNLNDLLRLVHADGASFLPVLLALEVPLGVHFFVPLRSALTNLLFPFCISPVLALTILELVEEFVDNILEWVASFAAANVAALVSTGYFTKGLHHLANESHRVLVSVNALSFFPILGLIIFISDDNHSIRGTTWSPNLKHCVIITLALFTRSTHIEVLLDGGLVTNATDRFVVRAAIARDTLMDNLSLLSSHINVSEIIRLNKLLKDLFGLLLELLVDEVLNSLSRNAELLNLGLLGTFDLLLRREGCVD